MFSIAVLPHSPGVAVSLQRVYANYANLLLVRISVIHGLFLMLQLSRGDKKDKPGPHAAMSYTCDGVPKGAAMPQNRVRCGAIEC